MLELAFADGQMRALARHKVAWMSATNPVVDDSALLKPQGSTEPSTPIPPGPSTPDTVKQTFNLHEQGETRVEPRRKLSEELCTSCRKPKHYGPCKRPIAIKKSDFNLGMTSDDAPSENPSTSPHYHSATSDSALARARDARPADEQAGTAFADLYRHLGISSVADEPGRMTGGLHKVSSLPAALMKPPGLQQVAYERPEGASTAYRHQFPSWRHDAAANGRIVGQTLATAPRPLAPETAQFVEDLIRGGQRMRDVSRGLLQSRHIRIAKLADFMLPGSETHSMSEQRGPSPNPYEERLTIKSPPVGWGDEGAQRIQRTFDQIDGAVDSTSIEDAAKGPQPGPLA